MELITAATPGEAMVERAVRFGGGELLWLRPAPFSVRCEPVRESGDLKLVLALEGGGVMRQGGRQAALGPGTFAWLRSDDPFELTMARGRRLLVRLPEELVQRRHSDLDLRTAVARGRDHAGERVVAALLHQLAREGLALPERDCATAASALLEAVGLCARAREVDVARARVERALASIELRLGDPALLAGEVAREQGVSRRYLDGLLRRSVGLSLAEHVRSRRLERAAQDLVARPEERAADVGRRWGFRDASHFTRVFRERYGLTPSEYRGRRPAH